MMAMRCHRNSMRPFRSYLKRGCRPCGSRVGRRRIVSRSPNLRGHIRRYCAMKKRISRLMSAARLRSFRAGPSCYCFPVQVRKLTQALWKRGLQASATMCIRSSPPPSRSPMRANMGWCGAPTKLPPSAILPAPMGLNSIWMARVLPMRSQVTQAAAHRPPTSHGAQALMRCRSAASKMAEWVQKPSCSSARMQALRRNYANGRAICNPRGASWRRNYSR